MGLDSVEPQTTEKKAWFDTGTEHPIQSTLEKNENLIKDWTKTTKTRDELKLLEVAAATQDPKPKM